jgi:hypothetical protein
MHFLHDNNIGEYVQKGTLYTCALSAGSSVFAVGNDRVLKELEMPDLAVVSHSVYISTYTILYS